MADRPFQSQAHHDAHALRTPPRAGADGPSERTAAAARWSAIAVLASASLAGLSWSVARSRPLPLIPAATTPLAIPEAQVSEAPAPAADAGTAPLVRTAVLPDDATGTAAVAPSVPWTAVTTRLDLNTAGATELELLPGIGPALAARIIESRTRLGPFPTVDALTRVRGIGPRTLEKIRPLARVE